MNGAGEHEVPQKILAAVIGAHIKLKRPFVIVFPTLYGEREGEVVEDAFIYWDGCLDRNYIIELLRWTADQVENQEGV